MENNQVIRVNGHILLNAFLQFLLSEMARLRNRNGTWSCRRYIPKNKNNRECYSFTIQLEQKVITSFHPISSFLLFWNMKPTFIPSKFNYRPSLLEIIYLEIKLFTIILLYIINYVKWWTFGLKQFIIGRTTVFVKKYSTIFGKMLQLYFDTQGTNI